MCDFQKNGFEIHGIRVVHTFWKAPHMVGGVASQPCSERVQKVYIRFPII